ncbi:MAG: DegT/DnrJ/EryC1/StrS family aminotransferase [Candidatus Saccharibacteria bacterium]|nr:DegT/DnrJ/EryC1/StrS family aminotransferase [Microbacteriaceae bacterium]
MPFDIPFIKPVFPNSALVGHDFDDIVESNWYTNFGPRERKFAEAIAGYVGEGREAVTFANATIGLIAVLQAVLGRGDNTRFVLIPSFTFAAGAEAIEWAGYRPLFVDIHPESLQPSLAEARAALGAGRDVAGILLCNTFGIGNALVGEWEGFAEEVALPLVIDSAAGFGSRYPDGKRVGSAAVAEVFSFHATKPFAIGEGGAVLTRDSALAEELRSFQNFGFRDGKGAVSRGLNGKLQEINAAIGLRQLDTFDEAIDSRQAVLAAYRSGLAHSGIRFPEQIDISSVCFASMLFDTQEWRDRAQAQLLGAGVEVRTYYSPSVHKQPHFMDAVRASALTETEGVVDTILSVPVHQGMPQSSVDMVVNILESSRPAS